MRGTITPSPGTEQARDYKKRRLAGLGMTMTNEKQPVTIKKYANRRLYNTGTSTM